MVNANCQWDVHGVWRLGYHRERVERKYGEGSCYCTGLVSLGLSGVSLRLLVVQGSSWRRVENDMSTRVTQRRPSVLHTAICLHVPFFLSFLSLTPPINESSLSTHTSDLTELLQTRRKGGAHGYCSPALSHCQAHSPVSLQMYIEGATTLL